MVDVSAAPLSHWVDSVAHIPRDDTLGGLELGAVTQPRTGHVPEIISKPLTEGPVAEECTPSASIQLKFS